MNDLPSLLREYAALDKNSIYAAACMRKAADEIDRLNRVIDLMDRKQRHGCTDANCGECEK